MNLNEIIEKYRNQLFWPSSNKITLNQRIARISLYNPDFGENLKNNWKQCLQKMVKMIQENLVY